MFSYSQFASKVIPTPHPFILQNYVRSKEQWSMINPIQAGGGGGTMCPPCRFFPCCAKQFLVDRWNLVKLYRASFEIAFS